MPYAIMRFAKRKGGSAGAIQKHHERQKEEYRSNPDIDRARTELNYHFVQPRMKYAAEINRRLDAARKQNPKLKVRKDSIKFVDTLVTASPEFFDVMPPDEIRRWFEHAMEFFCRELGAENIFSAVAHLDERNPHLHLCFVPLTRDHRLSAKEVIGDRNKLSEWQDKFHDHMSAVYPQLQRGEAAAVTRRKHVPTYLYKQAQRLTQQRQGIKAEIESIGALNAGRQREKVLAMLMKWYPQINAFEAKLRPFDEQLKVMRNNESVFRSEAEANAWRMQAVKNEARDLAEELSAYKEFVDLIPDELHQKLMQLYEQQLAQEQQQLE